MTDQLVGSFWAPGPELIALPGYLIEFSQDLGELGTFQFRGKSTGPREWSESPRVTELVRGRFQV